MPDLVLPSLDCHRHKSPGLAGRLIARVSAGRIFRRSRLIGVSGCHCRGDEQDELTCWNHARHGRAGPRHRLATRNQRPRCRPRPPASGRVLPVGSHCLLRAPPTIRHRLRPPSQTHAAQGRRLDKATRMMLSMRQRSCMAQILRTMHTGRSTWTRPWTNTSMTTRFDQTCPLAS